MKKEILNKIDWILPIIAGIVLFLLMKEVLSSSIYIMIATIAAFYYFPFRVFNRINEYTETKLRLFCVLSYLICATIMILSIVEYYLPTDMSLKIIALCIGIANTTLMILQLVKGNKQLALTHFCIDFIVIGVYNI